MKLTYKIFLFLCLFPLVHNVKAMDKDSIEILKIQADSSYAKENFDEAERIYLLLSQQGESAAVYYNLGCTYYRQDKMANAVLWLERAAQLDPSDDDIRFNLTMARSKTIDRIIPRHEMFFVSAWKTMMQGQSVTEWAYYGIAAFVLSLCLLSLYIFSSPVLLRKIGFFGAILSFLLCLLFNVLAYSLRRYNNSHTAGIVMDPAVTVRSTPTKSGTDLFVIHEGTRVEIIDNTMRDWAEVQIADGKIGWVEKSTYEVI